MLTKSDKIAKKSDSRLSDVLGREGISVLPKSSNIGYILCDIESAGRIRKNKGSMLYNQVYIWSLSSCIVLPMTLKDFKPQTSLTFLIIALFDISS